MMPAMKTGGKGSGNGGDGVAMTKSTMTKVMPRTTMKSKQTKKKMMMMMMMTTTATKKKLTAAVLLSEQLLPLRLPLLLLPGLR
jgi:hypothetical protein